MWSFASAYWCQATGMRMLLKPAERTAAISAGVVAALPQAVSPPVASSELPRFQPGLISADSCRLLRSRSAGVAAVSGASVTSTMSLLRIGNVSAKRPSAPTCTTRSTSGASALSAFRRCSWAASSDTGLPMSSQAVYASLARKPVRRTCSR